jgi:iron complex outermembrane receptor protein
MNEKIYRILILHFVSILASLQLFSQQVDVSDTAVLLPEVSVQAPRLFENTTGLNVRIVDSAVLSEYRNRMLTDLISQQTSIQVQSYNPGNLSTVTFRGTSSNHTGFLWNGISLNPVNNGQTDLSLLPVSLFDKVYILHGGTSSVFGEGNIGGGIHLTNEPDFQIRNDLSAGIEYGSFSSLRSNLTVLFSNARWYFRAGTFLISAENDFTYTDNTKQDKLPDTLDNAAQKGMGLMGTLSRTLKGNNLFILNLWYQFMDREIPGSLIYQMENADQHDRFLRGMLTWKKTFAHSVFHIRAAYFDDYLHYTELNEAYPEYDIDSKIRTKTMTVEVSDKYRLSERFELNSAGVLRFTTVSTVYYSEMKDQLQGSLFLAAKYVFPGAGWKIDLNLHQGWTEDYDEPFTPSVGLEGPAGQYLMMKMNVSHNFRSPTLNERYWQPGGNPELKPEKSWNEEITFYLNPDQKDLPVIDLLSVTAFHSMINDWIRWVPDPDDPWFWSPQNVQRVRSTGMESRVELVRKFGKVVANLVASYSFTRSVNENKEAENFRKQLPYVAEHMGMINFRMGYSRVFMDYTQSFTGSRATVEDHSESLPAFSIGRLRVGCGWDLKVCIVDLYFRIDNLFDVDYQVIRYYPNPGRAYTGGVNVKI